MIKPKKIECFWRQELMGANFNPKWPNITWLLDIKNFTEMMHI